MVRRPRCLRLPQEVRWAWARTGVGREIQRLGRAPKIEAVASPVPLARDTQAFAEAAGVLYSAGLMAATMRRIQRVAARASRIHLGKGKGGYRRSLLSPLTKGGIEITSLILVDAMTVIRIPMFQIMAAQATVFGVEMDTVQARVPIDSDSLTRAADGIRGTITLEGAEALVFGKAVVV